MTGLDYADQRFYASTYGRFNSPDPYSASAGPKEPGSWNRYAYVGGDPVNAYDPVGLLAQFATQLPGFDPAGLEFDWCKYVQTGYLNAGNPSILLDGVDLGIYGAGCGYKFAISPVNRVFVGPGEPSGVSCEDGETAYLAAYLTKYGSPLVAFAGQIVADSEAAGIDDRFIVALSGVESRYGTTQNRDSWGYYNVFSNAAHCATLDNPHCYRINPYSDFGQAIDGVTSLIGSSPLYQGKNSTAAIYGLYETGNSNTPSAATPLLNQIYGNQLGGDISNVRQARCP